MPNQVTRRLGNLLVLRENSDTPTDEEWDETLRLLTLKPEEIKNVKVLVFTDGGGPNAGQRKKLSKVLKDTNVRVAVVSDSIKVRFIVSSVALFTSRIRAFSMMEKHDAYLHLSLTPEERHLAAKNLAEMTAEVAPPAAASTSA